MCVAGIARPRALIERVGVPWAPMPFGRVRVDGNEPAAADILCVVRDRLGE
jgi:hypothetical protein